MCPAPRRVGAHEAASAVRAAELGDATTEQRTVGEFRIIQGRQQGSNRRMGLLGVRGGRGDARSDGPDGLVGDDQPLRETGLKVREPVSNLPGDRFPGQTRVPLLLGLADAEDRRKVGRKGRPDSPINDILCIVEL